MPSMRKECDNGGGIIFLKPEVSGTAGSADTSSPSPRPGSSFYNHRCPMKALFSYYYRSIAQKLAIDLSISDRAWSRLKEFPDAYGDGVSIRKNKVPLKIGENYIACAVVFGLQYALKESLPLALIISCVSRQLPSLIPQVGDLAWCPCCKKRKEGALIESACTISKIIKAQVYHLRIKFHISGKGRNSIGIISIFCTRTNKLIHPRSPSSPSSKIKGVLIGIVGSADPDRKNADTA